MEKVQVNLEFVRAASDLLESSGSARLVVAMGDAQRTVHVARGHFIHATSNLPKDRIGDMLVAERRLDPALLAPMAAEAERLGLLLGDMLIIDGLLTPTELAGFLERQALARFERTLLMKGAVRVEPGAPTRPTTRRSIAALVVELFREKVPFEAAQPLVLERLQAQPARAPRLNTLREARLEPLEAELCKKLERGEPFQKVFDTLEPDRPEFAAKVRFLASLEALGVFG